jgi:hypothetical protein
MPEHRGLGQLLVAGIFDAEELLSIEPLGTACVLPSKARIVRVSWSQSFGECSLDRPRDSKR